MDLRAKRGGRFKNAQPKLITLMVDSILLDFLYVQIVDLAKKMQDQTP